MKMKIREIEEEKYDFKTSSKPLLKLKGLTRENIEKISRAKNEPDWMKNLRLDAFEVFKSKPLPKWGIADLEKINFNNFDYYLKPEDQPSIKWSEVPKEIKKTFEKLGIPQAERTVLGGVVAQYESESVYNSLRKELSEKGVIFIDTDAAVKKYPELIKKHFMKCVPVNDNKFSALHASVWSGGAFVYVPKNVTVELPLQSYFRMNAEREGQFEHTIIIADEGSKVHYLEGCFIRGTEILTDNEEKPIENIKVGDKVLTHKGNYKKVYNIQRIIYTGKLYTIKYYGDASLGINVTSEHPFLAVRKQKNEYKNITWKVEWISAKELKKSDYLAIPIDKFTSAVTEREFQIPMNINGKTGMSLSLENKKMKTDEGFFRLAGYYLSEGSVSGKTDNMITFTFNKNEKQYIEDTANLIEKYLRKNPKIQKEYKNGVTVCVYSSIAARLFKQLFGKGAANKTIPKWMMHESLEKQKDLVKGIWRGDGSFVNKNYSYGVKRMFRINTVSRVLARQLRSILLRLGVFASINVQRRIGKRRNMYCLYIGGENVIKFASIIGITERAVASSRNTKMLLLNDLNEFKTTSSFTKISGNYAFVPIKSIACEEVVDLSVYNFSVKNDESYVAGGVAVHNCTAPKYTLASLHSAVVEIYVKENASVKYTTVQNWSKNVYNLNTKRAIVEKNGFMEWVGGSIGSKVSMLYPASVLIGENAKASHLTITLASKNTVKEGGAKVIHNAPNTSSKIISKSISIGGETAYRGIVRINKGAENSFSSVRCDGLVIGKNSKAQTFPHMEVFEKQSSVSHEAKIGKIKDDELFYLQTRGLNEKEATGLAVLGFLDDVMKEIPLEYALELNKLIELEIEGM